MMMMIHMFKFLHAADIHLDSPMHRLAAYEGAPVEELRQATRRAFENLIEHALFESVDFLLIAGDLFDGDWRDYNTGLHFVSQVNRLKDAGIPVFIISGNHDAASKVTKSLRYPENVIVFPSDMPSTHVIKSLGVAIHGQSYETAAVKTNLAAKYPAPFAGCFNIGMLHTCVTGREGHESYAPCRIEDFKSSGYDYWALGHVHKHEVVLDEPLTVFPGCIQGRHIRETGPKGCVLVSVKKDDPPRAVIKPLDVVRWSRLKVDVSPCTSGYDCLDAFESRLEEQIAENPSQPMVIRVELAGKTNAHDELLADPERWQEEVRSAALGIAGDQVWIEKVKIKTDPALDEKAFESAGGPLHELIEYLDELQSDPENLKALDPVFEDLKKKLPRQFKHREEGFILNDPTRLHDMLRQLRPMLIHRLMTEDQSE